MFTTKRISFLNLKSVFKEEIVAERQQAGLEEHNLMRLGFKESQAIKVSSQEFIRKTTMERLLLSAVNLAFSRKYLVASRLTPQREIISIKLYHSINK